MITWSEDGEVGVGVGAGRMTAVPVGCLVTWAPWFWAWSVGDGDDDDWIEPHREKTCRDAVEAHRQLAEHLLDADPLQAATILDRAIRIDPYNEDLYRRAMQAHHRTGDRDGVRRLHRALKAALPDLDAEPDDATTALVQQLLSEDSDPADTQ